MLDSLSDILTVTIKKHDINKTNSNHSNNSNNSNKGDISGNSNINSNNNISKIFDDVKILEIRRKKC